MSLVNKRNARMSHVVEYILVCNIYMYIYIIWIRKDRGLCVLYLKCVTSIPKGVLEVMSKNGYCN